MLIALRSAALTIVKYAVLIFLHKWVLSTLYSVFEVRGDISERDGQWVTSVSMLPHLETQTTFLRQVLNPHFSIFVHPHFLQTRPVSCCSSLAHTGNPLSTVTGVMKRAWLEFITMAEERKGESMTAGNRQALTVGSVSASHSLRVWDMGSWEEESIAEESLRNHFVPN